MPESNAAARDWNNIDVDWAIRPDKTAQWYEENASGNLPELAPTITTVVANKSSVVKLECVGCPFRVREESKPESWQKPPQDNSMLLNFTIDSTSPALLLNGHPIAPLAPMPLFINAFQVNANLSLFHVDKMTSLHMMDKSWDLGVKYGLFELQYEHSIIGMREPGKSWIQFDITGIIYPSESREKNNHYELRAEGQKMVQILLRETAEPHELYMEDVQVVERKDRAQPYVMKCGRLAMAQTAFNPLEWDSYGKFGTWSRSFNLLLWNMGELFWNNLPLFVIMAILIPLVTLAHWVVRRQQLRAATSDVDDAETGLLEEDYEDAPPTYEGIPVFSLKEEQA
ncbi:hypothetical protein N0V90_004690 [Kalmusia sp. IMI 367209]|nr:hypothetical protein N0V90_004690 [Kalmusia sp. IMI 367209]